MTIGELIRSQRKKLDFTLEDVGQYCSVPRSTVSRWENGKIEKIKRDKIEKLCKKLEIDPTVFVHLNEVITREERVLLDAYRKADSRAKEDALKTLLDHPEIKKEEKEILYG